MIGQTISHYEILDKLGGGGMGIVYKARDSRLDRLVALKFLPPELSSDEDAKARFMQEARAASALDHPNICNIHDIGETEDGRVFIVMAFYQGQTLKYRLQEGPFGPDETMRIIAQVADGLGAAHNAGIVHRDIKPANIMVTDQGRVVILDFGIAKLGTGMDLTKTGSTVGTVYYMSPEQIKGDPVDHRTDLWSLGVVLYQMLTNRRPFDGDYEQAVSYAILNQETPDLPEDPTETLSTICGKALTRDPEERFQNASEILAELGVSEHWSPTARRPRTKKQQWLTIGVPGLIVATLLLLAISMFSDAGKDEPAEAGPIVVENTIAVMPFAVGGEEIAYLDESMVDLLSIALQGAGDLRTVDPNTILGYLGEDRSVVRDAGRAGEVARYLGAGRFVLGSVTQLGPEIRINASLFDSESRLLQQADAVASSEQHLAAMVDTLVVQLVAGQVAEPLRQIVPVAHRTTSSFPALKAYLRGEYAYRQGRMDEGEESFRKALEFDSTFALAEYRWLDWGAPHGRVSERLKRHVDRLPERERMLFEAESTPSYPLEEKIRRLEQVTSTYPNYSRAWFRLGDFVYHEAYLNGMLTSRARPYLDRGLRLDPNNAEILDHLTSLAIYDRDFQLVDSLLDLYPHPPLEDGRTHAASILSARWQGDDARLDMLLDQWRENTPSGWSVWLALEAVKHVQDIPLALQLLDRKLDGPAEIQRLTAQGLVLSAAGRFHEADSIMSALVGHEPLPGRTEQVRQRLFAYATVTGFCLQCPTHEVFLRVVQREVTSTDNTGGEPGVKLYLNALIAFRLNDWAAFEPARAQLELAAANEEIGSATVARARLVEGLDHWRDGNLDAAIKAIESIHANHDYLHDRDTIGSLSRSHDLDRYVIAELLFKRGKYEEALPWFASLLEAGFSIFFTVPFAGPALLRRAEVYEQLGDTENAMDFYRRFIKLWQDADPELQPQVDEARRRLEGLIQRSAREPSS